MPAKPSQALSSLAKLRKPAAAAPANPAATAAGAVQPYQNDGKQRFSLRLREHELDRIKQFRTLLANSGRSIDDSKILFAALDVADVGPAFLTAYDAVSERDGRRRTSLARLGDK